MKPLSEALREIPLLSDLSEEQIQWLASHVEETTYEAGELALRQGEPAEHMVFMLEGEVQARSDGGPNLPAFIGRTGDITGLLPHSRLKNYPRAVKAVTRVRAARLHKSLFDEMIAVAPQLEARLIGLMADRIRETARADVQHEKLAALGKLSAGLAHELNNPAAAVRRSAEVIREKLADLRTVNRSIATAELSNADRVHFSRLEEEAVTHARRSDALDALTRSDREQELGDWLNSLGVDNAWDLAAELTDSGFTREALTEVASVAGRAFGDVLARVAITVSLDRLSAEIMESAGRMSDIVRSIKEYSYMDTAAAGDIDVHRGLENTITMLQHRLKSGIIVRREYDRGIPNISAHGGELNQVWTNLIDNAVDAMLSVPGGEKILSIRTALRDDAVLVEISDTGPGIPPEIRGRIFEPFFTTKKQGQGTGLGLDVVHRIVRNHHGEITFESRPGATCFQIRLPVRQAVQHD